MLHMRRHLYPLRSSTPSCSLMRCLSSLLKCMSFRHSDNAMRTELETQLLFCAPREVLLIGDDMSR